MLRFQLHRQIKSKVGRCRREPQARSVTFCGSYASPEYDQGTWSVRCGILRSKERFSKFENLKMSSCNRKIVGNSNSKFLTFENLFETAFRWRFDCASFCGVVESSFRVTLHWIKILEKQKKRPPQCVIQHLSSLGELCREAGKSTNMPAGDTNTRHVDIRSKCSSYMAQYIRPPPSFISPYCPGLCLQRPRSQTGNRQK